MADGVAITAGSGTTIATDDAGASGHVQIIKLAISTDGSVTLIPASSTDGLTVNLGTNNDVTVSTHVTTNAAAAGTEVGPAVMAIRDDTLSTLAVADADWTPLRTNDQGALHTIESGAWSYATDSVAIGASTAGGYTPFKLLDIDESEDEVKSSAGKVGGWVITNLHSADVFVKFYNATAASVTVGSTTPHFTIAIPATSGVVMPLGGPGIAFGTAICIAATLDEADADATAIPSANLVVGTVFYA